jgi:hypothetical protein
METLISQQRSNFQEPSTSISISMDTFKPLKPSGYYMYHMI